MYTLTVLHTPAALEHYRRLTTTVQPELDINVHYAKPMAFLEDGEWVLDIMWLHQLYTSIVFLTARFG